MKRSLRVSGYGDYIAVDLIDDNERILATPIYLENNGTHLKIKAWNKEIQPKVYPEDWVDNLTLKMENGELYMKWEDGPMGTSSSFFKITPSDLLDPELIIK